MATERWHRVEHLYHEAEALNPQSRAAFLAEACGADEELHEELATLLAAAERADHFIESPAVDVVARLTARRLKLAPGRLLLQRYEVIEFLDGGGMGDVYRAHDHRLGRDVAIKVLPPPLALDTTSLHRFEREARAVAALSHPNILAIHDLGSDQDLHFAVMELLEGETLRRRLDRGQLPWQHALAMGIAIAEGLAAAHAQGITHKDVNPRNIFLTHAGEVKILDFGIAETHTFDNQEEAARPHEIVGTPGYMSPEQLAGQTAGPSSDVFALGRVLDELVESADAPESLTQVIQRAMTPNPAQRWTSAREMAQALRRCEHTPRSWPGGSLAVALFAVILPTLLGLSWRSEWSKPNDAGAGQHLISAAPGSHRAAALSPDGHSIAFVHPVDGIDQIWIKGLQDRDARQLTFGQTPAARPRWSPKGDRIVFARRLPPGPSSVWSVAVDGNAPVRIIENARNPNWAWDGDALVFERDLDVWVAGATGINQRRVEGIPRVEVLLADRFPTISPDGTLIAFFQPAEGAPMGDLWVVPLNGGAARRLTTDAVFAGAPAWLPDGRFIVFPSARGGSLTLWKAAVTGGPPEAVLVSAGEDTEPDVSRDGRSLVYTNTRTHYAIVITDPATGQTREVRESRSALVAPSFSPRGDRILFFEVATGIGQLFTIDVDGTRLTQLTQGPHHNALPQWAMNGSSIYYYQYEAKPPRSSFRRIVADGHGPSEELASDWGWAAQNGARVDPTGSRIIYSRLEQQLPVQTRVRDVRTGHDLPFRHVLLWPRWSPDGASVLGMRVGSPPTEREITICTRNGESCRPLTTGHAPQWSADGTRVYYLRPSPRGPYPDVWSIARDGQRKTFVASLPGFHDINMYDVSPDGQIVWVQFKKGDSELWRLDLSP